MIRTGYALDATVAVNGVTIPIGASPPSAYGRSSYSAVRSRGLGPRLRRFRHHRKNAAPATASAAMAPTTPPTTGPVLEPEDDEDEGLAVCDNADEEVCVENVDELLVVPLLVVDAHFVNVLLFDAAKSFCIDSFVKVLRSV